MRDFEEPKQKLWFKIPENIALMSDEEMRVFTESLWLHVNIEQRDDYEER
jgi:hypothetical protein